MHYFLRYSFTYVHPIDQLQLTVFIDSIRFQSDGKETVETAWVQLEF